MNINFTGLAKAKEAIYLQTESYCSRLTLNIVHCAMSCFVSAGDL